MEIILKVKRLPIIISVILVFSGCTTAQLTEGANSKYRKMKYQRISAGFTGCMPNKNEVEVHEFTSNGNILWTAACNGKEYLCSGNDNADASINCALKIE